MFHLSTMKGILSLCLCTACIYHTSKRYCRLKFTANGITLTHFYVKPVNSYAKVVFIFNILFSGIELFPFVNVLATCSTSHVKWSHQSYGVLAVLRQFHTRDLRRIEIRRIVFLKTSQNVVIGQRYIESIHIMVKIMKYLRLILFFQTF